VLLLRAAANGRRALAAGITTVRDLGGRGGVTFVLRDAIRRGLTMGPRIVAAGSPITITGGHCYFLGLEADGEAAVRAAARRMLRDGASCLKIMATGGRMTPRSNVRLAQYTSQEIAAGVNEARRAGVSIAAHAIGTLGIRNAVEAGVDTVEHCSWLGEGVRLAYDEAVAVRMAECGISASPTLTPIKRSAETADPATLSPAMREHIALRPEWLGYLQRMRVLGVPFMAGTDAGVGGVPFDSLPSELELLVEEVGLSPVEAIHAATGHAATVLRLAEEIGTVAIGRRADLVAAEGDPTTDIRDLRRVHAVLQAGRLVARDRWLLE
jgi:imidazolonepropionase-like amidohydrolase